MPQPPLGLNIAGLSNISVMADAVGTVTGLSCTVEVNYGPFGQDRSLDLWPFLSEIERAALQGLYDKARVVAQGEFVAN